MQFDGTFFAVILSFTVFMLLMRAVYFEPVRRIKEQREAKKAVDRKDTEAFVEEHERLRLEYETGLKEARLKAQKVIQELRQDAKKQAGETVGQARDSVREELDRQLEELSRWREEAYAKLVEERKALVRTIIDKVTAGRIPAGSKS